MTSEIKKMPRHIAVIMDGNGRWAKARNLPRFAGHYAGYDTARNLLKWCAEKKIEVLTLFTFSSENWKRPTEEVSFLLNLFATLLVEEIQNLNENQIQLHVMGDLLGFSPELQNKIAIAQSATSKNTGLKLVIAANYGGRWDVTQAVRRIAEAVSSHQLTVEEITPEVFQSYLYRSDLPEPDLFIRTSGERRISNFLIWQLAYTELFFTDVLWPDFSKETFEEALDFFASRQRRFGYTGEQVEKMQRA